MKRSSGVLMHISSLWGDYSCGSFGKEAKEWIDFLAECKFKYWQVLPFCLPDDVNSPYMSYSAFSGNLLFVDLPTLYENNLITEDELSNAKQLTPYVCEFERLNNERFILLKAASKRFNDVKSIDKFMKKHPQIEAFCKFMALKDANDGEIWQKWKINDIKAIDDSDYKAWRFIEYMFFTQWKEIKDYANAKDVKIIGDIPIYMAADSSDVWANPNLFELDSEYMPINVAGCPPDYFSEDGQLWGNPLYNWKVMKEDGYKWWCDRIGFMCEFFDGIRIDHFRGFDTYYSIPASATTARTGKWRKGPGMDLIKRIKEIAKDKLMIAEDLGDITDSVRKLVKDSGFPNMGVFQFGFLGDVTSNHTPHNYVNNQTVYTGTHDNNTLLGFIWECDEATRKLIFEYCGYYDSNWDKVDSYNSILRTLMSSAAGLVIFPVQDLLLYGADTRLNVPGVKQGNWGFRFTKDQLNEVDKEKFIKWNNIYGRA